MVKTGRWEVAEKLSGIAYKKKPAAQETSEPSCCPDLADGTQNLVNFVAP